jgi:hypothetical protein
MHLTPDTTAILVADRRSARETAARRRRTLVTAIRQAMAACRPAPARLRATDGRTPSEAPAKAA